MNVVTYNSNSQQGAVLAIALIFLVVLTLLGVTAMQTTSVEQKMAGNLQQLNRAFHGAESGITAALANASNQLLDTEGVINYVVNDISGLTIETEIGFEDQGELPPPGYSLSGDFTSYYFHVNSEASAGAKSKSTHQRGFYVVGPKPDTTK